MKIICIDRLHSSEDWVAFRTDEKISRDVENKFEALYAEFAKGLDIKAKFQDSRIYVSPGNWSADFVQVLSELIAQAAALVTAEQDLNLQKKKIAESKRDALLEKIALSQNVPID